MTSPAPAPSSSLGGVGYDLVFWKQEPSEERSAHELYVSFAEGQSVDGIPELPVEAFVARLMETFPSAVREPNGDIEWLVWTSDDGQSGFEVVWTPQYVWATLRPLHEDAANRMIDVAIEFGCALYDPQVLHRFELP
jgi:hypothetical protein